MTIAVASTYTLGKLDLSSELDATFRGETNERLSIRRQPDGDLLLSVESDVSDETLEAQLLALPEKVPDWEDLPEEIRRHSGELVRLHGTLASSTVRFLRWRYNLAGEERVIRSAHGMTWRTEGGRGGPFPRHISIGFKFRMHGTSAPSSLSPEDLARIQSGRAEPLGHGLLREAMDLQDTNPRAALVIGIAALEIGVKECIADLVPGAAWLVEAGPTPPVEKMLRAYLPKLPVRRKLGGKTLPPAGDVMKVIVDGIAQRNKLVHWRATPGVTGVRLNELLYSIRDVLYLLDGYRGDEWAADQIRVQVLMGMTESRT